MTASHMHVQRIRSSPSALRSPLTSRPLGAGTSIMAAALLGLATCCTSSQQLVNFSPGEPKNYLLVHSGSALDFGKADCISLEVIHDSSAGCDARASLQRLLRERLPELPICRSTRANALVVQEYETGRGVCIDCGTGPSDPQSGFAFISVTLDGKPEVATAEWQYWRGGSAIFMLEQVVSDLTNLYIHGLSKHVRPVA